MSLNKVEVIICGKRFVLKTEDEPEYAKSLARMLDQRFEAVFCTDDSLALFDASVLVAIELLDEGYKTAENIDNLRMQIKEYAEEATRAENESARLKRELEEAKGEIEKMKTELAICNLKKSIDNNNAPKL